MFYQIFLGDCCLGKQCYGHCKYKYDKSSADIRIGDLWGKTYKDNEDGVSCAVAFTQKGNEMLKQCNCEFAEHSFDVVAEGQMRNMPKIKWRFGVIRKLLKSDLISIRQIILYQKMLIKIDNRITKLMANKK